MKRRERCITMASLFPTPDDPIYDCVPLAWILLSQSVGVAQKCTDRMIRLKITWSLRGHCYVVKKATLINRERKCSRKSRSSRINPLLNPPTRSRSSPSLRQSARLFLWDVSAIPVYLRQSKDCREHVKMRDDEVRQAERVRKIERCRRGTSIRISSRIALPMDATGKERSTVIRKEDLGQSGRLQ